MAKTVITILDNGQFTPYEAIILPKYAQATLVLYENTRFNENEDMHSRMDWLNRIEKAISESTDEDFPDIARSKTSEPHGLQD